MAVTEYTWNPLTDSVIEETDGAGNVVVEYTNEPAPYGPLISEHRGSESRQYHFDALGSTRALTDDSENVTDTFAYDAWGREQSRSGTSLTTFCWVGHWGYRTGAIAAVRVRLYSSATGAWSSQDTLAVRRTNRQYTYCTNNPITQIDPAGLLEQKIDGKVEVEDCPLAPKYAFKIKWAFNKDGEGEPGYIFQEVEFTGGGETCDGQAPTPNMIACKNQNPCSHYVEMWIVGDDGIDNLSDTFGHVGFREETEGKKDFTTTGKAYYIAMRKITPIELAWIQATFLVGGPKSAKGACDLPSVCLDNQFAGISADRWKSIKGKSTRASNKQCVRKWNCCECKKTSSLTCTFGANQVYPPK